MTTAYKPLNLPTRFTFRNVSNVITGVITIWYDASGKKLRKIVDDRTTTNDDYSKDYLDGIALHNGIVDAVAHPEGRIKQTNVNLNLYQVEYQVQDHLGNTRVMFSDLNNNGTLFGATTAQAEIIQVNHYYPFGMNMEGPWNGSATDSNLNKYQYNGKELNQDFGLDWNDYGARWYDATIGRWHAVDPLAEKMPQWTVYNYVFNNPVHIIDPDGNEPLPFTDYLKYTRQNTVAIAAYKQGGKDAKMFELRVKNFNATQTYTVHTGEQFVKALENASEEGAIDRLIVASHSSEGAIFMNDDAGLYGDGIDKLVETFVSSDGSTTLDAITDKISEGKISFSNEADVLLLGCNTGAGYIIGLDSFAENFSEAVPNVFVTGAADKASPLHLKNAKGVSVGDSNTYVAGDVGDGSVWKTFQNGKLVKETKETLNVDNFKGGER